MTELHAATWFTVESVAGVVHTTKGTVAGRPLADLKRYSPPDAKGGQQGKGSGKLGQNFRSRLWGRWKGKDKGKSKGKGSR